jgi:hypothetical protein
VRYAGIGVGINGGGNVVVDEVVAPGTPGADRVVRLWVEGPSPALRGEMFL